MRYDLDKIISLVSNAKHKPVDGWFFPGDIVPHSSALKYACKKLFEQGKMERQGEVGDRWGYRYKIKDVAGPQN